MESRRKILKKIGLTTAAAGLAVSAAASARASAAPLAAEPGAPEGQTPDAVAGTGPWWLLAPLKRGSHLGGGWFLAHLGAVRDGASVITLQHAEHGVARAHLCMRDGQPRGLAHTAMLDLVLMDGGQGDKATEESLGRVLLGLARVVADNELHADGDLRELARMQPHEQRVAAYGPENLT
ncbi:MAG: hypothetical protein H6742_09665 [Alphaproteobacteria bacterium]|nr:hypothetical protein [Alphaproteobacteria bacterium]